MQGRPHDVHKFRSRRVEPIRRNAQFVIKISKLCNLRCQYCYEYPHLGNPDRMSRAQLATIYRNLEEYYARRDAEDGMVTSLELVWHGGEPLMQPPQYFWDTFADQDEIFGERPRRNAVQTNLMLLDEERMRLLVDGFDKVGVSLDVIGGLRVNIAGRDSQSKVIDNLRRLRAARQVGCITVLTARNVSAVEEIFRFFEQLDVGFRVLPLFDTDEKGQTSGLDITQQEELAALAQFADLWLGSDQMERPPAPLDEYAAVAVRHLVGNSGPVYRDRREWLPLILVNTDGECYTYGENYGETDWSIGNLMTTSLSEMLAGQTFERCASAAERRVALNCLTCPFFKACGGTFIAETEQRERDHDTQEAMTCMARPMIEHLTGRLRTVMPDLVRDRRARTLAAVTTDRQPA